MDGWFKHPPPPTSTTTAAEVALWLRTVLDHFMCGNSSLPLPLPMPIRHCRYTNPNSNPNPPVTPCRQHFNRGQWEGTIGPELVKCTLTGAGICSLSYTDLQHELNVLEPDYLTAVYTCKPTPPLTLFLFLRFRTLTLTLTLTLTQIQILPNPYPNLTLTLTLPPPLTLTLPCP
jgi:hypothetical protein